jgi:hypothetical protein
MTKEILPKPPEFDEYMKVHTFPKDLLTNPKYQCKKLMETAAEIYEKEKFSTHHHYVICSPF